MRRLAHMHRRLARGRRIGPAGLCLLLLAFFGAGVARAEVAPPALAAARAALQAYVAEQAGVPGAEAFVGAVRLTGLPAGEGPLEVLRVGADGPVRSGRGVAFFLFVRDARGDVRELRASADVSLLVPVVVSVRNVPAGAVLGAEDIALKKREQAAGGDDLLHREADALGKRARWQLSGGVPVRRDYLEDPESLRRGDPVLIVAEAGSVRITGKGISLQGGRVGETVLVRNVGSGKDIAGRLQAGRVVRVD